MLNINGQGTQTGRISAKKASKSNTPKSDVPTVVNLDEDGELEGYSPRFEMVGCHLGPRSKFTHPYSYDPLLQFRTGIEPTGSVYSDRLRGWYDYALIREKMKVHFGNEGDYYNNRSSQAIQAFLRDLLGKPHLQLTRIEEHCNQASGFPVWFFAYRDDSEQVVAAPPTAMTPASKPKTKATTA